VILDNLEDVGKKDLQLLLEHVKIKSDFSKIVLGASEIKPILELFLEVEKSGSIIDLSLEKQVDKERRFAEEIQDICKKNQKKISQRAIDAIFNKIGLDICAIENEINKVVLFVKDKDLIDVEDVNKVVFFCDNSNIWQIAENIVWQDDFLINLDSRDDSFLHQLLSAIRYQLQQGIMLSSAKDERDLLTVKLPYKILQIRKQKAKKLGFDFFKNGLKYIYEVDLLSKTGVDELAILIDLFRVKLKK